MKQNVITYLTTDRGFASGIALYSGLQGASKSFAARLNRQGESVEMRNQLHYEIAKAVGISEGQMRTMLSTPLAHPVAAKAQEAATETTSADAPKPSPEVAQALQLYRQFPFLREANCPPELKQLVAQKVEAFYAYQATHPDLFTAKSEEEMLAAVTTTVEAYLDNQAAFAELNHFATTGKILGEHPIFAQKAETDQIKALSAKALIQKRNALVKSINGFKAEIEKGDRPDLLERRQESLAEKQALLAIVDAVIDAKG